MIYVLKIIWDYRGAAIGTYRPQYRPLSAIRYIDVNPLPTRNMLFSTLVLMYMLLNTDYISILLRTTTKYLRYCFHL
jgi:hypothetical protein